MTFGGLNDTNVRHAETINCATAGSCFVGTEWTRLIWQEDDPNSFAMSLDFHCVVSQIA